MSDRSEDSDLPERRARRHDDVLIDAIDALVGVSTQQIRTTNELHKSVELLAVATQERLDQLRRVEKSAKWRTIGFGTFGVILLSALLILGTINRNTLTTINDCVKASSDPDSCYARSRNETTKVVGAIIDTNGNGRPDAQEILDQLKAGQ